jgi:transglutaminase-like putative cysteine protease
VIFAVTLLMFVLISWQTVKPLYVAAYVAYFAAAGLWLMIASEEPRGVGAWRAVSLALTLLMIMAGAGAVFAATPRFSNPRFAQLMRQLGLADMVTPEFSIVSLHERMTLGNFDDVRTNGRRVMQVRVRGRKATALEPLRVRAGALDRFDGDAWERTVVQFVYRLRENLVTASDGAGQYNKDGGLYFTEDYERNAAEQQIEDYFIYPMDLGLVFSVGEPTAVEGGIVLPSFDATGTVYSASTYRAGGRYVIRSQSRDFRLYDTIEGYDAILSELFLQLPEGIERIRELAYEIAGRYPDPWGKAVAIRHWLKQRFKYSYLGAHARQSLDEFLFETRAANCEYFATAMAVMLRTLGVPSRLVVGYLTDEWDNVEGYYYVRNSDGHAWVEAFIPGRGWVAFDPTPATSEPPPLAFPLGREIYMYFLGLQMSWYRYVIGYDFYVQQNALSRIIARWRRMALGLLALSALVAAALAARWALGRAWLPRRRRVEGSPARRTYERALKKLARKGFVRMRWQTPGEFARLVVDSDPKLGILLEFTEAYYAWRFGSSDGRLAMRLLDELGASLAKYGETSIGPKG